jgi:hypothetical protein
LGPGGVSGRGLRDTARETAIGMTE